MIYIILKNSVYVIWGGVQLRLQFSQPTSLLVLHLLNLGDRQVQREHTHHLHCRKSELNDYTSFAFLLSRMEIGTETR